jgi:hypothetical protein
MLTAWALTRPDDPLSEPAALSRWLAAASPALLDEHGPAVVTLVLDAAPDPEVLRWIDAAAGAKRVAVDQAAVRLQLLAAETRKASCPRPSCLPPTSRRTCCCAWAGGTGSSLT